VVVVDVALLDFGRADVAPRVLARDAVCSYRSGHGFTDNLHRVAGVLDQVKIFGHSCGDVARLNRRLRANGLNSFGPQDHFRCRAGILARVMVLEHEA